jgi:hypothetical protein
MTRNVDNAVWTMVEKIGTICEEFDIVFAPISVLTREKKDKESSLESNLVKVRITKEIDHGTNKLRERNDRTGVPAAGF